jgi:hypothetical protein
VPLGIIAMLPNLVPLFVAGAFIRCSAARSVRHRWWPCGARIRIDDTSQIRQLQWVRVMASNPRRRVMNHR